MTDSDRLLERALAVLLGGLLIRVARTLALTGTTAGVATAVASVGLLVGGLGLVVAAVLDLDWLAAHRHEVATIVTGLLGAIGVLLAVTRTGPTTDALAFGHYAGDLLLSGQHPYTADMSPALERYPRDPAGPTPTVDGGIIRSFSYPPAAVLWFVPGALLAKSVAGGASVVPVVALVGVVTVLLAEVPDRLALAVPAATLAPRNLWVASAGGIVDAIWVLPVVAAMAAWRRERWLLVGVALGVAVTTKQQAWTIAPLALVVLARRDDVALEAWARTVAVVVATAGAISVPFVLWAPVATVQGSLLPFRLWGPPMVQSGIGLVQIGQALPTSVGHGVYQALLPAVAVGLLAVVARWPRRTEWLVWLAPALVLLVAYRSLPSYFIWAPPVGLLAIVYSREVAYAESG